MYAAQLFSTLIIIITWALINIRMMRGSRDTEDWSNDAENTALITEINNIWQGIHIGNSYFEL